MARLTEKQTLGVILGVSLLLTGGAGGGVWWAKGLVEEEHNQIAAKEKKRQAAQVKIRKIPEAINEVIVLRESVAEHVKILPNAAEIEEFLRATQRFVTMSGIVVEQMKEVRTRGGGGAFQPLSYQLKFDATLWQFMKLMNFFESYERFVKVRGFSLNGGDAPDDDSPAVHSIAMTVETYRYTTQAAGKLAKIAGYEEKRKKLMAKIRNSAPLLLEDPYQFRGKQGRRDPFVDPRRPEGTNPNSLPAEEQKRLINELGAEVAKLQELWNARQDGSKTMFEQMELQRRVVVGIKTLEPRVQDQMTRNGISVPALRSRWFKEVSQPFKELSQEVLKKDGETPGFLTKSEFASVIKKMKEALINGSHEDAVHQYQAVFDKTKVPASHPLYRMRNRVEGLALRARVALEFAGKQLEITGVLVNAQGKSGVIINGEVFEEGEFPEENLFVKKVREEEVEFVYRGFTLVKTF